MVRSTSPWIDAVPDQKKFPELKGEASCDVLVIGAGITGVTAAHLCATAGKKVVLIDKNHVGTGDTGLTTGFLTRVPDTSPHFLETTYGTDFVRDIFKATRQTQVDVFDRIQKNNIDCDFSRCNSYYSSYAHNEEALLKEWAAYQKADSGSSLAEREQREKVIFSQAVEFQDEGRFNSRKYLFKLLGLAPSGSLQIFEETEAIEFEAGALVKVKTGAGMITAQKMLVACGNPKELFPELSSLIDPFASYVIAARFDGAAPLAADLFWDTLDPYFYYRTIDEQTIIVGGADIAFAKTLKQKPYEKLEYFLKEKFSGAYEITNQWSGSIFHTADGLPYVFEHPHYKGHVYIAAGFGGNGLIFGSLAGQLLTDFTAEKVHFAHALLGLQRTKTTVPAPERKIISTAATKSFVTAAKLEQLKPGKPVCSTVAGKKIAIFPIDGSYYALENNCSHAGGSLSEGNLEGSTVECPLHFGKFDVKTGAVVGPPAIRSQKTYPVRVSGNELQVEIELSGPGTAAPPPSSSTSAPKKTYWGLMLKFATLAALFWLLEFAAQFFWLAKGELGGSLVRSFALAGATLVGSALFSSALFRFWPRLAVHWRIRRYLGVSGFIFIFLHVVSVYNYFFGWDILSAYYSLNPIENPIIFGSFAFPILFVMAATSTDWAVQKLTPKIWKIIHRFVYIAYIASVFHFMLINPVLLKNPPGYLLLAVTAAALLGQLYWYIITAYKRRFHSLGSFVGIGIIIMTIVIGILVYTQKIAPLQKSAMTQIEEEPLDESLEKMKEFMAENPIDADVAQQPLASEKNFNGEVIARGDFQNVNYMTTGTASVVKQDGKFYVVFEDNFETPNGPDLQVYLTKNTDKTVRKDIIDGLKLAKLKSIKGRQTYEVPAVTKIEEYHSVSIHCRAFNVPWSYAPLTNK